MSEARIREAPGQSVRRSLRREMPSLIDSRAYSAESLLIGLLPTNPYAYDECVILCIII